MTSLPWLPSILDLRADQSGALPTDRRRPLGELVYADGWKVVRYNLPVAGELILLVTVKRPGGPEVGVIPSGDRTSRTAEYDKDTIETLNLPGPDILHRVVPGTAGRRLAAQYAALLTPDVWLDGLTAETDPVQHDRALHHLLHWAVEPGLTWPRAKAWMDAGVWSHTALAAYRQAGIADPDIADWAQIESGRQVARYYVDHLSAAEAAPWIRHVYGVHGSVAAAFTAYDWTAQDVGNGRRAARDKGLIPAVSNPTLIEHLDEADWEHALLVMAAAAIPHELAWAAVEAGLTGEEAVALHQDGRLHADDLHAMAALRRDDS